jgi:DNA invertase Pin-like site-specific DNA recombinase
MAPTPSGQLIGYARVSTRSQKDESQIDELEAAGCAKIFTDRGVSGKLARRPELDACLAYLRAGDVLVITRLSRAMRSLRHLLELAAALHERGIGLKVLKQDIDTTTVTGRLVFNILASIDEFQRELIVEGTREGLASARARGRVGGRKPKLSERQVGVMRQMYASRQHTIKEIAQTFGVSHMTVYRHLERDGQAPAAADRSQAVVSA